MHFLIEAHLNETLDLLTHPVYSRYKQVQQFLKWKHTKFDPYFIAYRTEFRFHSDETLRRVGTCDLMAIRKNHPPPDQCNSTLTCILVDWKNTILKQAYNNETMKGPCISIPQSNVGEYTIQQSDYACLAREFYKNWKYNGFVYENIDFEEMRLVAFSEENDKNEAVNATLDDVRDVILALWEERYQEVTDWYAAGRPQIVHSKSIVLTPEEERNELLKIIQRVNAEKEKQQIAKQINTN